MIYKIVFDTNVLRGDKDQAINAEVATVRRLHKFIQDNKISSVELCFPELVTLEWLQFKVVLDNVDAREVARKMLDDIIKKYGATIFSIPVIDHVKLVDRALTKVSPFRVSGESDPGFKDTVIFLSIKEDALKQKGGEVTYIFLTRDGGFTAETCEEINKDTGQELLLRKDAVEVEDLLDEKLSLGLKRGETREKIQEIISDHQEILRTYLINKYQEDKNNRFNLMFDRNAEGYGLNSFGIEDFREQEKNKYFVTCSVTADIHYRPELSAARYSDNEGLMVANDLVFRPVYQEGRGIFASFDTDAIGTGYSASRWRETQRDFLVQMEVDISTKNARIIS